MYRGVSLSLCLANSDVSVTLEDRMEGEHGQHHPTHLEENKQNKGGIASFHLVIEHSVESHFNSQSLEEGP